MLRSVAILALAMAASACAAEEPRRQVIRLDLDQIAAATAARDRAPGFESLGPERAVRSAGTEPAAPRR